MHALMSPRRTSSSTRSPARPFDALALVVSLVAVGTVWLDLGAVPIGLALLLAASAAIVDLRTGRIPDRLVVATLAPVVVILVFAAATGRAGSAVTGVAVGAVLLAGPLVVVHLLTPAAMGFGDVKLAASLGGVLGLVDPRVAVLALCIASGLTGIIGLAWRRRTLPFGPGLVVGAVVGLVVARYTVGASLRWR